MGRYPLSMSTPTDRKPSQTRQPTLFKLPAEPPHEGTPATTSRGRPRLRTANREQIVFRAAPLEALLPHDHPARTRTVWDSVEGLDLAALYDCIRAVERRPGRAPIDPRILRALWLSATI